MHLRRVVSGDIKRVAPLWYAFKGLSMSIDPSSDIELHPLTKASGEGQESVPTCRDKGA